MELSVHALRSFIAISEERQFGRAATRLHVTTSALSELIGRTEKRLDTLLFVRTPRGAELTEAGRELLPLAHAVAHASDAVADWAAGRSAAQHGRVRVGLAGATATALRARILDHLRQRHPDLEVLTRRRSQRREALADLRNGRLDVAYVPVIPGDPPGLRFLTVGHDPRVLVVPAGHRLAGRSSVSIEETNDEVFLEMAGNDARAVAWWLVDPRADGSHPARGGQAGDFDDMLDQVASGRGLCLAPSLAMQHRTREGTAWIPLSDAPEALVALYWRADERDPAVLAYLASARALTEQAL